MNALTEIIKSEIRENGPMGVDRFMALALGHSVYGYYMNQDPFGADGDFTTAPEISQMFGEMIGAWVVDIWTQMGAPTSFSLVECGGGRGTLMMDIMRATKSVTGFHDAVMVHMIETSPVLNTMQAKALLAYNPDFHDNLRSVPINAPIVLIANELLDALPVKQFIGTQERHIVLKNDVLSFDCDGDVQETSPARDNFMQDVQGLLKRINGAALLIDYGHPETSVGDTLQALYRHEYCDVLSHIGDADVTAHVDFEAVQTAASDLDCFGVVEQGAFLKTLGIDIRTQSLLARADEAQARDIQTALHRLTHPDEMGALFKVIGFGYGYNFSPAGF